MPLFLDAASRARILPFAVFMVFLVLRGLWPQHEGADGTLGAWLYGVGALAVAATLVVLRHSYAELRGTSQMPTLGEGALGVGVGLVVFALWISLDAAWMQLGEPSAAFVPVDAAGALRWDHIVIRWIGAALVVPVMEELFWRSYLMRWIDNPKFMSVDPRTVTLKAVLVSTAVFMLAHTLWLAAIVAGLAYAWLYRRTGKLWVAVIAHAVTNGVLGAWVVMTRNWQFW